MNADLHWVKIDTGFVLSDHSKPWGSRTQGAVFRCKPFDSPTTKWLGKIYGAQQLFDDAQQAMTWVEVVVKLQ